MIRLKVSKQILEDFQKYTLGKTTFVYYCITIKYRSTYLMARNIKDDKNKIECIES